MVHSISGANCTEGPSGNGPTYGKGSWMMNVFEFAKQSPDIDLFMATVDERLTLSAANARFKFQYRVDDGESLPAGSQLGKAIALAVKQRQNIAGLVIEESFAGRTMQLLLYVYRSESESGGQPREQYHIALFDVTGLFHFYETKLANERRKLIGDMAAGTANSILNPLAVVKGSLQLIESTLKSYFASSPLVDFHMFQNLDQYLKLAYNQVQEISSYVKRWLLLGKPFQLELRPVLVSAFLETFIPTLQREAIKHGVPLVCEYPASDGSMLVDPHYLKEVLSEFVKNSFEASNRGEIRFSVQLADEATVITIRDTGTGIAPEILEQARKPFFTTKETAIGLGLNFCEVVLDKMGGHFQLTGSETGTEVRIVLPKAPKV